MLTSTGLVVNTLRKSSKQLLVSPITNLMINRLDVSQRLSGAIQIPTISTDAGAEKPLNFLIFHKYLAQQFPLLHKTLKKELINDYSLLYEWKGSDESLAPILLLAHQDVVPIAPGTESQWQFPPFSGVIANGFIWGRGSWDNKGNLMSMMEAIEILIHNNFKPKRTIYLASGHDEETGPSSGQKGAKAIAEILIRRGIKLAFVLDEGLLISQKIIKGIDTPVALIGVAEKGYLTLKLTSETLPGHSSMPSEESAIVSLSRALTNIEQQQFPPLFSKVVAEMFEKLAPEFSGLNRLALSNLWLFGPYVRHQFQSQPSTAAMIKTTTAFTTFKSGNKENVLPGQAEAQVNFRILPGNKIDEIIAHTKAAINNIKIKINKNAYPREPSRISQADGNSYLLIEKSIREVFPGTLVAPGLMIATTDSHHFELVANNVYRFSPVRAEQIDLQRFHGTNERVSIDNYIEMIQFYYRLMSSSSADSKHL